MSAAERTVYIYIGLNDAGTYCYMAGYALSRYVGPFSSATDAERHALRTAVLRGETWVVIHQSFGTITELPEARP